LVIAYSESKIYQFISFNNEFSIDFLEKWDYTTYKKLVNEDYFTSFTFEDSVKDKGVVRLISPEEFREEELNIISNLEFSQLSISDEVDELCIVKDMDISSFPHNLLLNQKREFIAKDIPVSNVLSTEWFMKTAESNLLPKEYSKSIWIPTESGDYALNYLYSNIEETLKDSSFQIFNDAELQNPLSSDINIICSHGGKNISEIQIVSQEGNSTYNLDSIIGTGSILIFFVCYSGSMKTEFFRNNITSLTKRFISNGYDAVIAPFWALDVTIPHYWLPEFLNEINSGSHVSKAVFKANRKVYERYPTPAAWACLHLYGNANHKIID
jgi:hypothetical protein